MKPDRRYEMMVESSLAVSRNMRALRRERSRETASVWRMLVALLAVVVLNPIGRADDSADWNLIEEHWFVLEIDSQTAGWMHAQVFDDGKHYRDTSQMVISVNRGSIPVSMEIISETIETHAGEPARMFSKRVMSQQPIETEWVFEEKGVTEISRQGSREMRRELPQPEGKWLMPRAALRFYLERARAGAEDVTYRTIEPGEFKPITVSRTRVGEGTAAFDGREIPITIWTMTNDEIAPLKATEQISSDGHLVYQELPLGVGTMVLRRATREDAIAARGAVAPELFFELFVTPDKAISNVIQARQLTLRLRTKDGEMPELPSVGAQRFTMDDEGDSAVLVVNIDEPIEAHADDAAREEYLQPSQLVDSEDELVQALARRTIRGLEEDDRESPAARAEAMRAFVAEYVSNKNLDTAFASASETARTRTGDCSEHAVLLAAMLRAADIPARTASGLVYVEKLFDERGAFGWHMWTQAMIDGKWIDLDATLPVPYHAGHILTNTSALASGTGSDMSAMLLLVGNLEIEVVPTE